MSEATSTLDVTTEDGGGAQPEAPWKQTGRGEKEAPVHEQVKRMQKLPAHSTYFTHRLRVLNKILQLLSIQKYVYGSDPGDYIYHQLGIPFPTLEFMTWSIPWFHMDAILPKQNRHDELWTSFLDVPDFVEPGLNHNGGTIRNSISSTGDIKMEDLFHLISCVRDLSPMAL